MFIITQSSRVTTMQIHRDYEDILFRETQYLVQWLNHDDNSTDDDPANTDNESSWDNNRFRYPPTKK
jgi:hypothetical protein